MRLFNAVTKSFVLSEIIASLVILLAPFFLLALLTCTYEKAWQFQAKAGNVRQLFSLLDVGHEKFVAGYDSNNHDDDDSLRARARAAVDIAL